MKILKQNKVDLNNDHLITFLRNSCLIPILSLFDNCGQAVKKFLSPFRFILIVSILFVSCLALAKGVLSWTPERIEASLTPDHIKGMTPEEFAKLSPAQRSALRTDHLQVVTQEQLQAVGKEGTQAWTAFQINSMPDKLKNSFTKNQVQNFTEKQVQSFKDNTLEELDVSRFTLPQKRWVTPNQISQSSSKIMNQLGGVQNMTNNQLTGINEQHIPDIPAKTLLKLTPKKVQLILKKPQNIPELSRAQLHSLGQAHIRELTPDQTSRFTKGQMRILKPLHVRAFTPDQTSAFGKHQIRGLTSSNRRVLHSSQIRQTISPKDIPKLDLSKNIHGLAPKIVSYLTPAQKKDLLFHQYNALSLEQFQALTPEQIRKMTPEQIRALDGDKIRALTEEQASALTPEQLQALKNAQLKLLDDDKIITPEEAKKMDQQTEAEALCLDGSCFTPADDAFKSVCEAVVKSPICQDVEEDRLIDCDNPTSKNAEQAIDESIFGCLDYSLAEIFELTGMFIEWIADNFKSLDTRQDTGDMKNSAQRSMALYFHSEYEKALETVEPPQKKLKAVLAVSGPMAKMMYQSAVDVVSDDVKEWSCLNIQGKSGTVCRYIAGLGAGTITAKVLANKLLPGKTPKGDGPEGGPSSLPPSSGPTLLFDDSRKKIADNLAKQTSESDKIRALRFYADNSDPATQPFIAENLIKLNNTSDEVIQALRASVNQSISPKFIQNSLSETMLPILNAPHPEIPLKIMDNFDLEKMDIYHVREISELAAKSKHKKVQEDAKKIQALKIGKVPEVRLTTSGTKVQLSPIDSDSKIKYVLSKTEGEDKLKALQFYASEKGIHSAQPMIAEHLVKLNSASDEVIQALQTSVRNTVPGENLTQTMMPILNASNPEISLKLLKSLDRDGVSRFKAEDIIELAEKSKHKEVRDWAKKQQDQLQTGNAPEGS